MFSPFVTPLDLAVVTTVAPNHQESIKSNPGIGLLNVSKITSSTVTAPMLHATTTIESSFQAPLQGPLVHLVPFGMHHLLHSDQFLFQRTDHPSKSQMPPNKGVDKPHVQVDNCPRPDSSLTLVNSSLSMDSTSTTPWRTNSLSSKKQTPRHGLDDLCNAVAYVEGNEPVRFGFDTEERYRQNSAEYIQYFATPRKRSPSTSSFSHRRTPSARSDGFETDTSTNSRTSRSTRSHPYSAPRPGIGFGRVNVRHRTKSEASNSSTLISEAEQDIPETTTRYGSVTTSIVSFHEAMTQLIKPEVLDKFFPDRHVAKPDADYLTPVQHPAKYPKITWSKTPPSQLDPSAQGYHLLVPAEVEVCELLRLVPNSYLAVREAMLRGQAQQSERIKKIDCKKWFAMDVNKVGKLYDWFCQLGWM